MQLQSHPINAVTGVEKARIAEWVSRNRVLISVILIIYSLHTSIFLTLKFHRVNFFWYFVHKNITILEH